MFTPDNFLSSMTGCYTSSIYTRQFPASSIHSLQHIQNCAARLVLKKRESDHITPLFQALHWLLIKQSIRYKINTLCYRYITCAAPSNLCDLLQLSTPSRTLRSASDTLSLSDLSYQTFHCLFPRHFCLLFPRHFCLRSLYME